MYSSTEEISEMNVCAISVQIANHSGYVQVDWKKVEKDVNKAKKHLKKKANKAAPEINTLIEEVKVSAAKLALFFLNYAFAKKCARVCVCVVGVAGAILFHIHIH